MFFVLLVYQSIFSVSVTVRHINDVTAVNQSIVTRIPTISLQHTNYARVGVKYISLNRDQLIVSGGGGHSNFWKQLVMSVNKWSFKRDETEDQFKRRKQDIKIEIVFEK